MRLTRRKVWLSANSCSSSIFSYKPVVILVKWITAARRGWLSIIQLARDRLMISFEETKGVSRTDNIMTYFAAGQKLGPMAAIWLYIG